MQFKRSDFPPDFLFGAATSSYQIEGHGFGGAGETHWDTFAATPGNVVQSDNGAIACDHYHRYEQDLDLIAEAGFDCYRFSTSWARVLPEGRGKPNPEGLDFYDRLTDAMLERDLKPCATLYHWELPSPLGRSGWLAKSRHCGLVCRFQRYYHAPHRRSHVFPLRRLTSRGVSAGYRISWEYMRPDCATSGRQHAPCIICYWHTDAR